MLYVVIIVQWSTSYAWANQVRLCAIFPRKHPSPNVDLRAYALISGKTTCTQQIRSCSFVSCIACVASSKTIAKSARTPNLLWEVSKLTPLPLRTHWCIMLGFNIFETGLVYFVNSSAMLCAHQLLLSSDHPSQADSHAREGFKEEMNFTK